jgi:flagellar protein FlaG
MNIPIANLTARFGEPALLSNQPVLARTTQPISAAAESVDSSAPKFETEAAQAAAQGRAESVAETEKELSAALADANRKFADDGREMRFEYDSDASKLIVRLVDTGTHEVLRQFPSNEALRAARLINSGKPLISMQA